MTRVRVQIPYLPEREAMLHEVESAYRDGQQRAGIEVELATLSAHSWGEAHNIMLADAGDADYVLTANDDCIPHPGALRAAANFYANEAASGGNGFDLPGCRMVDTLGVPLDPSYDVRAHGAETPWMRMFFAPPAVFAAVGPLLDLSWYVDIDYCQRLREHGYRLRMVDGFSFTHLDPPRHWAETPADHNGVPMREVERQHLVYREACAAAGRSPLV